MTKFENKKPLDDSGLVTSWLQENISGISNKPISVSMNRDGTISKIEIGKTLTKSQKDKIILQFPELEGKEVEIQS